MDQHFLFVIMDTMKIVITKNMYHIHIANFFSNEYLLIKNISFKISDLKQLFQKQINLTCKCSIFFLLISFFPFIQFRGLSVRPLG